MDASMTVEQMKAEEKKISLMLAVMVATHSNALLCLSPRSPFEKRDASLSTDHAHKLRPIHTSRVTGVHRPCRMRRSRHLWRETTLHHVGDRGSHRTIKGGHRG